MEMKKTRPAARERWWVLQRHHDFEVVQSESRPEHKNEIGKRAARTHGPFKSKADAEAHATSRYDRTLKAKSERHG